MSGIRKNAYEFFTPAALKPTGWLKKQLEVQADGLSGNLDRVWPDVRDSAWVGGDREGWERVPYWLDGFIPLAYLLDDADRIARAKRYMDAIMDKQAEDGWICPCKPEERCHYDLWAALLMGKVLMVYADCAGEDTPDGQRAVDALHRMLRHLNGFINGSTLHGWGAARWFEGVIPALWLYERRPEDWIIDLCHKLEIQGFDWVKALSSTIWETHTTGWDFLTHVVNVAMMLKCDALMSRVRGGDPNAFARAAMDTLLREHGMACGHFTGDECLSGTSPIHGSELCSVVEAMYSYEILFSITGDTYWLDRLETTGFNALPATFSPDMWTHQYDQLSNQVAAVPVGPILRANGPEAVMFGLEPNFGCCTANLSQGFPKMALSTFMKCEDGIASCVPAPAVLRTTVGGAKVQAELDTAYPFRNALTYRITTDRAVRFTLRIRIPSCAVAATVNGEAVEPGTMYEVRRRWEGEMVLRVELAFETTFVSRPDEMWAVRRGPLLYALPMEAKWEKREYEAGGVPRVYPYCDYLVTPTSAWAYGFAGDTAAFVPGEGEVTSPFASSLPPVWLEAPMAPIAWSYAEGHCARLPDSREATGPVEIKRLVPYGWAKLRITETYRVEAP